MVGNKFEKILGREKQGELDSLNQSFYETIVKLEVACDTICQGGVVLGGAYFQCGRAL